MATLLLAAVGTVVGGPLGGAIGAAIGSQIDQALFTPKGARGPRLAALAVQGSSYGTALPRVFGTMRLAGTVIWATDLREDRHKSGGGKGRAKTTTYSYSASFAVALSARAILRVGRIWADGNLLRGAGGDWKSDVGAFRLHPGDEAQMPDPLIAAAEGIGATPAYRGIAYAVFEDLQLADFGNRIPQLSFELIADPAPLGLATIAAALSDGDVGGAGGPLLDGYAAAGDSVRGAIEALAGALPVAFATAPAGLRLVDEDAPALAIDAADLGTRSDAKRAPRVTLDRRAAGTLNETIAIDHADPARDYQTGSQRARRGAGARRTGAIELPAAVSATAARAIAEDRLAREWAGREQASVTLPPRWLGLAAGAIVTLPGLAGRWRVTRRGYEAGAVTLEAVRLPGGAAATPPASAGRATAQPDIAEGATTLALLDLPAVGDLPVDAPTLLIAAAGAGAGWRRATAIGSVDDGADWITIGATAPEAVIGTAVSALPPGDAMLADDAARVEIALLHDGMALAGDDRLGWSATANLMLIGDELIQFGRAEAIGPARWRLSRLLRGRRGTEWAMAAHVAGERAVLIEADTLLAWSVPAAGVGARLRVAASGRGDAVPAEATIAFVGAALLPPAPVALAARGDGAGGVRLAWVRRSRAGWSWRDGGDAPLGEEVERYRVTIAAAAGATIAIETAVPGLVLDAGTIAALGAPPYRAAVAQLGTFGASRPTTLSFTIGA